MNYLSPTVFLGQWLPYHDFIVNALVHEDTRKRQSPQGNASHIIENNTPAFHDRPKSLQSVTEFAVLLLTNLIGYSILPNFSLIWHLIGIQIILNGISVILGKYPNVTELHLWKNEITKPTSAVHIIRMNQRIEHLQFPPTLRAVNQSFILSPLSLYEIHIIEKDKNWSTPKFAIQSLHQLGQRSL